MIVRKCQKIPIKYELLLENLLRIDSEGSISDRLSLPKSGMQ